MKEQFVTYEIALKLKELGFDEECLAYFHDKRLTGVNKWNRKDLEFHSISNKEITNSINEIILAPLWQQAIDWFRKHKDIHIVFAVNPYSTDIEQVYGYKIYNNEDVSGLHCIINYEDSMFTCEYARELAMLEAIELQKNN